MKLEYYSPIFKQVLFKVVREEKTASGIYIPGADFKLTSQSDFFETEKVIYDGSKSDTDKYEVVKVAEDCERIAIGDLLVLGPYAQPTKVVLDDKVFYSVTETHLFGRHRLPKVSTMDDFTIENPTLEDYVKPTMQAVEGDLYKAFGGKDDEPEFKVEVVTGMKEEDYDYKPIK